MPRKGPPDPFPGKGPPDDPFPGKPPPHVELPFAGPSPFIDAFVANWGQANQVLLNDGDDGTGSWFGTFTAVDPLPGNAAVSTGVALGDMNRDGYLDAFVANFQDQNNIRLSDQVLLNDGDDETGTWTETFTVVVADPLPGVASPSSAVALGDLNGDGYLDAFVGNWWHEPDHILLNDGDDGTGTWTETFTTIYPSPEYPSVSAGVALGDLNGDGYLDAFVANTDGANKALINDGDDETGTWTETFTAIDPSPGDTSESRDVALGDLNGDGYLDAVIAHRGGPYAASVLINDGDDETGTWMGTFTALDPPPGNAAITSAVALGDLNGDGYLDAFIAIQGANQVLVNDGDDGTGTWTETFTAIDPLPGDTSSSRDVALSDFNGDGYLDAFVANWGLPTFEMTNQVLLNDGDDPITGEWLGTFTPVDPSPGDFSRSADVALGDINGDGTVPAVDETTGLPNLDPSGLLLA